MKINIYCRVSSEDQNVEQQVQYCKKWFIKNGYNINKIVKDTESGRLPLIERKQFHALLKENKHIGIFNLDRLTRNWDDITLIEKHFREQWGTCNLISTADTIDLSNASGRMMFRIKMCVSCYMPEDMREKQIIGINRAREEGKYKGGKKGRKIYNRKKPTTKTSRGSPTDLC